MQYSPASIKGIQGTKARRIPDGEEKTSFGTRTKRFTFHEALEYYRRKANRFRKVEEARDVFGGSADRAPVPERFPGEIFARPIQEGSKLQWLVEQRNSQCKRRRLCDPDTAGADAGYV